MQIIKSPKNIPSLHIPDLNKTRMVIQTSDKIHLIKKANVIMAEASGNYSRIFMNEDSPIFSSKTLKYYAERLGNSFLRVHQSYLVNPQYIKTVSSSLDLLTLHNGEQIPISRSKRKLVQDFLNAYFD